MIVDWGWLNVVKKKIDANPARFRPIRVGPLGHLKVKPSDPLACGGLLDVLVCMLGIDPNPDVRLFAGTKINVRPIVHVCSRRKVGQWETPCPMFTRPFG